jgi:hypothetical protein
MPRTPKITPAISLDFSTSPEASAAPETVVSETSPPVVSETSPPVVPETSPPDVIAPLSEEEKTEIEKIVTDAENTPVASDDFVPTHRMTIAHVLSFPVMLIEGEAFTHDEWVTGSRAVHTLSASGEWLCDGESFLGTVAKL